MLPAAAEMASPPEISTSSATEPAASEVIATPTAIDIPKLPYVRIKEEKNKFISLEIASRDFVPANGQGPKVCLVAVSHIADKSFYQSVQKLLDSYDVVLYESVKPAGAGGAHGDTEAERVASTRAAMQFVGGLIEAYRAGKGAYPADIEAVKQFTNAEDPRLGRLFDVAMIDAWGHRLVYQPKVDPAGYDLVSLGADGTVGGEEFAADITLGDHLLSPLQLKKEDGLQSQLASALGLKFQLDSLSYDKPNWRCSDLALDEVTRALAARGLDFEAIGGTLAGSSLPAKIISFLLNLMKVFDTKGQLADTFKVIMIQLLGDPALMERGLVDQLGEGFNEVIVVQRNQRAIDDLLSIIKNEPPTKSVAILYGAAHMPDLVDKLMTQLGYRPVEGPEGEHWFSAIKVDFTKSVVSPEEVMQLRMMIKQMMRR